jgi:hypothetical protein
VRVVRDTVPATELIMVVKNSIKRANVLPTSSSADLRVATVQLILKVVTSNAIGGGLDIRVPVVGMRLRAETKATRRDTHTLDITLRTPKQSPGRELRDSNIEDALVDAIGTVREVMAVAAEGDDPWELMVATVDISFIVTDTGALSLGFDGEVGSELTHCLRLGLAGR